MSFSAFSSSDPAIYAASRARDGSDAVDRRAKLEEEEAVERRKAGEDIVVCGSDTVRNKESARWRACRRRIWASRMKRGRFQRVCSNWRPSAASPFAAG